VSDFEKACEFEGGKCEKIATSVVQLIAGRGKWYACCDTHAHHAMRHSKPKFRDINHKGGSMNIQEQIDFLNSVTYGLPANECYKAADTMEAMLKENEEKDSRIDWTVSDNAEKAIKIADLLKRQELLEKALVSLSATYGANIKDEFERSGRGSNFRDSLECSVDELGKEFSDRCVDVFYDAMKMTVNEAIAKAAGKQ